MTALQQILSLLEDSLDPEHIKQVKISYKKSLNWADADRTPPIRVLFPNEDFRPYPYSEAFHEPEKMLFNELLPVYNAVKIKDDTVPMIRANYGVGIIPSLFGLNTRMVSEDLPWVDHLNDLEQVKRLIDRGSPDFRAGLGAKIFATHAYYQEQLACYPKCFQEVSIYHADLQGPFSLASSIWGSDIYFAVYDYPDLVHSLLKLVTETYIGFMKELKRTIQDQDEDFVFHWGAMFKGRVVLRNDTAVTLSREMYEEFVKPYDQQIFKAFAGGSMHFCGRADQWIFSMIENDGLGSLNFGQPPKQIFGFDFLEKIYDSAGEKKIAIVDYIMPPETVPVLLKSRFQKGITYQISVPNRLEAQKIVGAIATR